MPTIVMFLPRSRVETANVPLPPDWELRFLDSPSADEILAACREADCLLTLGSTAPIDARLLEAGRNLKLIQCLGAGFNHVDLTAAERLGIPVANSPGENAATVAEFTIGAIIALQRRLAEADDQIKSGNYAPFRRKLLNEGLQEIGGSRIGLVGLGNIGLQVAKIAVLMGASVCYFAASRKPEDLERQLGVQYKPLDSLLSTSDILSLHVPLNSQTKGLIDARALSLMPPAGLLINTSRGEVVDQQSLAEALEAGRLAGAAVDTFSPEPPGTAHPLLNLSSAARNRLLLTPHIAGVTAASFRRMLKASVDNMNRVLQGEPPYNVVNSAQR